MNLVNYHVHTSLSPDSEAQIYEMVSASIASGIEEICITDHCDLVDGYGKYNPDPLDLKLYFSHISSAQRLFGDKIRIKSGIELGEGIVDPDLADKIAGRPELDFVISATHNLEGMSDYFFLRFLSEKECRECIEEYLDAMLATAKLTDYDVLAHLTYPLRYMRTRDGWNVDFRPYDELMRELFHVVVGRSKGIELNTSGYKNNGGEPMPPKYLLDMYKDCGGEIITIGSDAHKPEMIAAGLRDGYELLRETGFNYITIYDKREPEFIKI